MLPNPAAQYFRYSGKVPPVSVVAGVLGGLAAAMVLAVVYAYAVVYIPLAGVVTFILSGGFGFLLGLAPGLFFKATHLRNLTVARVITLGVSLVGFYASWVAWVFVICQRGDVEIPLISLVLEPGELWNLIVALNEVGTWSLKGSTPTGGILWALWIGEALLVLGTAGFAAFIYGDDLLYCEDCGKWCPERSVTALEPAVGQSDVEARDWASFQKLGPPTGPQSLSLHFFACDCKRLAAMTVKLNTTTVDKKGKESTTSKTIADRFLLDAEELALLEALPSPEAQERQSA